MRKEAIIVAFRRHTLLPPDGCLYALQPTIPHLTRSSLHRCLQRRDISRPHVEGDKRNWRKFKTYPIGCFHVDIAEVRTEEGKLNVFGHHIDIRWLLSILLPSGGRKRGGRQFLLRAAP